MCGGRVGLDNSVEATQLPLFLMPSSYLLFPPRIFRLRVFQALIKGENGNKT